MKNIIKTMLTSPSTREKVSEILTDLFGNTNTGIIFLPENTTKRSGGRKKATKHELKTSTGWSAKYDGNPSIWVSCVGMSMTEFIKEYNNSNIHYLNSNQYGFQDITIYKNNPEFKTYGCVRNLDLNNGLISLYLAGLIYEEEITTKVISKTPNWIINSPTNCYASFNCKIYQSWRSLNSFEQPNWDKVWNTFKFQSYLSKEEAANYF